MACDKFKCVPEIKESNESGEYLWKHKCPINNRNCWVSEHEIYTVWNDIYNLFKNTSKTKIINNYNNILETFFVEKTIANIEKRRSNFTECKDIIVKVKDKNNKEIGHFSLHSKIPNYYESAANNRRYSGCGYYEKKRGDKNDGAFHYKGKNNYIIPILFNSNFQIIEKKIIPRQIVHFQMYNLFARFWNNYIVPEIANYYYKKLTPINEITQIADSITPMNINENQTQWGFFSKLKKKNKTIRTRKTKTKTRKTKTRKTKSSKKTKTRRKRRKK